MSNKLGEDWKDLVLMDPENRLVDSPEIEAGSPLARCQEILPALKWHMKLQGWQDGTVEGVLDKAWCHDEVIDEFEQEMRQMIPDFSVAKLKREMDARYMVAWERRWGV